MISFQFAEKFCIPLGNLFIHDPSLNSLTPCNCFRCPITSTFQIVLCILFTLPPPSVLTNLVIRASNISLNNLTSVGITKNTVPSFSGQKCRFPFVLLCTLLSEDFRSGGRGFRLGREDPPRKEGRGIMENEGICVWVLPYSVEGKSKRFLCLQTILLNRSKCTVPQTSIKTLWFDGSRNERVANLILYRIS